jgi:hypothetical protein
MTLQQQTQRLPLSDMTAQILELDTTKQHHPLRLKIQDVVSGEVMWFSAFEAVAKALEAGGVGPWAMKFDRKPWANGQGEYLTIRQAVMTQTQQAQPQQVQQAQQVQPQQVQNSAPQAPSIPDAATCSHGVANSNRCNWCIIRQCGFKEIADKGSLSGDEIYRLTNLYENILLGDYTPMPVDEPETQLDLEVEI